MQAVTPYQPQERKTPSEFLTEEDFYQAAKDPKSGNLSESVLQDIKDSVVGEPVGQQWLSTEQLRQGGYSSWREFRACRLISAW